MAKLAYTPAALFLLRYLNYNKTLGKSGYHNASNLVEEFFPNYLSSELEYDLYRLEKNELINVDRQNSEFSAIITDAGREYFETNRRDFESFDNFFLEKDFFPEGNPSPIPLKKPNSRSNLKKKDDSSEKRNDEIILKHALSHQLEDIELHEEGYKYQGLIGYINNKESDEVKMTILNEVYLIDEDDYLYSTNLSKESLQGHQWTPKNGEEIGLVNLEQKDGCIKLFRFFKQSNQEKGSDHFYCTKPISSNITANGYVDETQNFEEVFLWKESGENRWPVYVYSKTPDIKLFEPLKEPDDINGKFDYEAFLWSDAPTETDELGREKLTNEVIGLVRELFAKKDSTGAYTILLKGEWGSGKSSMLNFLRKKLGKEEWKIIDYNAWENQQFKDPWWILINAISEKASKESFKGDFASHTRWKMGMQYRNSLWALALIAIFIVSGIILFNSNPNQTTGPGVGFYASIIGLVGSLISVITGLINNFFFKSVSNEDLKERFTEHPFKKIRQRFNDISKENDLAIFIDDLDRCESEPTVKLLEGIQTLFKDNRVLYIIAADGHWLIKCFDQHYKEFSSIAAPGHSIGEKFLEKSFQLKVTVPIPGKNALDKFYNKLIGSDSKAEIENEESPGNQQPANPVIQEDNSVDQNPQESTEDIDKSEKDKVIENLPQFLREFRNVVPKNPRQLKRFINQYIITRATLKVEGVPLDDNPELNRKVVRFLIFSMEFPSLADQLKKGEITKNELFEKDKDDIKKLLENIDEELIKGDFYSI
ncbi:P-loop NTPase fold protein [Reichenbachiella sp. MALMAid0571]|uniref:P-loop NTPase fold protein n=1 Tax=Reichenbachiella sp. MALMAid0571 TaxID=3143939 RepID=UPI0032DFDED8